MKKNSCVTLLYMFAVVFGMSGAVCSEYFVILKEVSSGNDTFINPISRSSINNWEEIARLSNSTINKDCVIDLHCSLPLETHCSINTVINRRTDVNETSTTESVKQEVPISIEVKDINNATNQNYSITTTINPDTSTIKYVNETKDDHNKANDAKPETSNLKDFEGMNNFTIQNRSEFVLVTRTEDPYIDNTNKSKDTKTDYVNETNTSATKSELSTRNPYVNDSVSTLTTEVTALVTTTENIFNADAVVVSAIVAGAIGTSIGIYFVARKLITRLQSGSYRFPEP